MTWEFKTSYLYVCLLLKKSLRLFLLFWQKNCKFRYVLDIIANHSNILILFLTPRGDITISSQHSDLRIIGFIQNRTDNRILA